jgi:hypothetical protein
MAAAVECMRRLGQLGARMPHAQQRPVVLAPEHHQVRQRGMWKGIAAERVARAHGARDHRCTRLRIDERAEILLEPREDRVVLLARCDDPIRLASEQVHAEAAGVVARRRVCDGARPVGGRGELLAQQARLYVEGQEPAHEVARTLGDEPAQHGGDRAAWRGPARGGRLGRGLVSQPAAERLHQLLGRILGEHADRGGDEHGRRRWKRIDDPSDLVVDGAVEAEQGVVHPLARARPVTLRTAAVLPRLMPSGVRFGEHGDDEIVRTLLEKRPHAGALARRARDETIDDRSILGHRGADLLTDLFARTERSPHLVGRRRRLRGERERRIVRVGRPLAHLQPGQSAHGLRVGRIEHEHRTARPGEVRPERLDAEVESALQLEAVGAGHRLPEEVEAVARGGHARERRGPDGVLEQELLAAGARPRAACHEPRHRG